MQAWNDARLFARVNGYLHAWTKDIGAQVAAGTELGSIDTPELDQQIVQARADLASARANASLAKSTAGRWNDLLSTNSVSKQEADEKNGDLAAKNAAVQGAAANLDRLLAQEDLRDRARAVRRRGDDAHRRHRRSRGARCDQPAAAVLGRRRAQDPRLCQRAPGLFGADDAGRATAS